MASWSKVNPMTYWEKSCNKIFKKLNKKIKLKLIAPLCSDLRMQSENITILKGVRF